MKTIAERVQELILQKQPVYSKILGCMGKIEAVWDGTFILEPRSKRHQGCFGLKNAKMNHPQWKLAKIDGQWILGHRKTNVNKLYERYKKNAGAQLIKTLNVGI